MSQIQELQKKLLGSTEMLVTATSTQEELSQIASYKKHSILTLCEQEIIQHEMAISCFHILFHVERILGLQHLKKQVEMRNDKHEPPLQYSKCADLKSHDGEVYIDEKTLENYYKMLLSDLKRAPVKYVQTVYKDYEKGKIVIDIKKGNNQATCKALQLLPQSKEYFPYLDMIECESGEFLMQASHLSYLDSDLPRIGHPQYNIRIGNGSLIGCINASGAELQALIEDKDMKSINDIQKKYPSTSKGTLTCIAKKRDKYYIMTAQHVLDKQEHSSNQKQVFSQVHCECEELLLADVVHLASSYSGRMDTISVDNSDKAVDVALMPMKQSNLDEALLKLIPVYCRAQFEDATQSSKTSLVHRRVKKTGAITGQTEGKIISTDCVASLDPQKDDSPTGEMFAVVGLSNTTQPFAVKGDSGSLVTIKINENGRNCEYALGIIAQRRPRFLGRQNVALCVRMEDCLKALESSTGFGKAIDSRALDLYVGFLRPFASLYDRTMPHVEVKKTSTIAENVRICVYSKSNAKVEVN